jgi:hypothetical protein
MSIQSNLSNIDYKSLVESGMYIDKTSCLELIEFFKCASLFRPKGFGKTLLLSTMRYYFDYKFENQFDELFKGTYVHDNPSPARNSYSVLLFDFSRIKPDVDEKVCSEMSAEAERAIKAFLDENKYELHEKIDYSTVPAMILDQLFSLVKLEHPIYLLIDEYDHFIDPLRPDQRSPGFLSNFFEIIKDYTPSSDILKRIFFTGTRRHKLGSFDIAANLDHYSEKYPVLLS